MLTLLLAASAAKNKAPDGPLLAGDSQLGYYGEVPPNQLIKGSALASAIGLSAGSVINDDEPWLKFAYHGKVLLVAKKPLRSTISWLAINAVGAAYGQKTIVIGGQTYKVRLLKGGNADPSTTDGGEWNDLMYPVHATHYSGLSFDDFNNADLGLNGYGAGSFNWCQEAKSDNAGARVIRAGTDIRFYNTSADLIEGEYVFYGWRPVLERMD